MIKKINWQFVESYQKPEGSFELKTARKIGTYNVIEKKFFIF
jgi:hypothetical protein